MIFFLHTITDLAVRTLNRPGSQLLGANGRDDGALVISLTFSFIILFVLKS